MKTEIFAVDGQKPDMSVIRRCADIIKNGGLVAFPTETVYGLGANGLDAEACKGIYEAKGRPSDNPLILHISELSELSDLAKDISEKAKLLISDFWPGPMTLIFKKKDIVPDAVTGGLDTVAVRFPENRVARLLIKESGVPIAAPSANTSGKPSPTRASHVEYDLGGRIDAIIDGGACEFGLESTIVDVSGEVPCLLRPGSVTVEELREAVGEVAIDKAVLGKLNEGERPKAPGMKYTHYSPNAEVTIVRGEGKVQKITELANSAVKDGKNVGILAVEENKALYEGFNVLFVGTISEPESIAANIFKMLRKCDYLGYDYVLAEGFEEKGIGLAIMNRLKKAAGYNIIEV